MENINVAGTKLSLDDINTIFKVKPSLAQYFKSIIEETLPDLVNKDIIGVVVGGKTYMSDSDVSFCDIYFNLMNESSKVLNIDLMINRFTGTIKKDKTEFVKSARKIDYKEINGGYLYMRSSNQDKCDILRKLCEYSGFSFEVIYS